MIVSSIGTPCLENSGTFFINQCDHNREVKIFYGNS